MEALLLKSHRESGDDEPLLTVSTSSTSLAAVAPVVSSAAVTTPAPLNSKVEILAALRGSPSLELVVQSLKLLTGTYNIQAPSAIASQLVNALLEKTLPDFWSVLSRKEQRLLSRCLASPAGLGGIATRLKSLIPLARDREGTEAQATRERLRDLLALLQMILGRVGFVRRTWILVSEEPGMRRDLLWKEFATLTTGGRLVSLAAEADGILGRHADERKRRWVGDGKKYVDWLGKEIAEAVLCTDVMEPSGWKALSTLLVGSFRLGYIDTVVESLTYRLIRSEDKSLRLQKLVLSFPAHDKRLYLNSLLQVISKRHFQQINLDFEEDWWKRDSTVVSGAASLLDKFILNDDEFRSLSMQWLTSTTGGGVGEPVALRRAIMAVIATDELAFRELFEKAMQQFSDKLWIRHTPIVRQEVNVQILLLCAGYAHRHAPSLLARIARSSDFLNGVSHRLAASSQRAKFLGMIVGETFSDLVHEDKKMKMSFDTEETQTDEARWWKSIPSVSDRVGTLSDLFITVPPPRERKHLALQATATQSADTAIQAIPTAHSTDSEDDEFTPYALPDSDPGEASDEDATTIDRNKPSPPVYIRDLLSYLRASDSYDRQLLALTHASAIIRRKSTGGGSSNNTGTELSSHLDDLLSTLITLDDRFEIPTFSLHRDAALISLAVSSPVHAGHWLSRQFFLGDYGLSQRATLLMVIGNAARELAGLVPPAEISKRRQLPGKAASIWGDGGDGGSNSTSVSTLASTLSKTLLTPLAASAADSLTGPNVLKVRTFSSRLAVEARRGKPMHRKILGVVGQAFFFPLTGGWWVAAKDFGGAQPHADAHLLSLFLNTLSVLMHAAGPAAPALGQMSAEFFELLLNLRGGAAGDVRVAEAVLLGMLTVLEVNVEAGAEGRRRLAEEHGREVVECKEWVEGVFDGVFGGEESVRRLAAGVLVKVGEVAEDYRRTLLGGLGIED